MGDLINVALGSAPLSIVNLRESVQQETMQEMTAPKEPTTEETTVLEEMTMPEEPVGGGERCHPYIGRAHSGGDNHRRRTTGRRWHPCRRGGG
jgi:hypothetical protein